MTGDKEEIKRYSKRVRKERTQSEGKGVSEEGKETWWVDREMCSLTLSAAQHPQNPSSLTIWLFLPPPPPTSTHFCVFDSSGWLYFANSNCNSWCDYRIKYLKLSLFQTNLNLSPKYIHSPYSLTLRTSSEYLNTSFLERQYGKGGS